MINQTDQPDDELNDAFQSIDRNRLMWLGLIVEGGLALLAIALSYLAFYDHNLPLAEINWPVWKTGITFGLLGTIPLLIYLVTFHFWNPWFFAPMRQVVDFHLRPLFSKCNLLDMILISLMAGFGEELFFRWCLQGGITFMIGGTSGVWIGLIIASLVFGICHWVNWSYGTITMVVGAYLGMLMIWTNSFIASAIAHSLFDLIALLYIVHWKSPVSVSPGDDAMPSALTALPATTAETTSKIVGNDQRNSEFRPE